MAPPRSVQQRLDRNQDPADGPDRLEYVDHFGVRYAMTRARLGTDDLAVELGQPDRERCRPQRGHNHARARRMDLECDDQREADDRAVDDASDLARSQMGFDRLKHLADHTTSGIALPGA